MMSEVETVLERFVGPCIGGPICVVYAETYSDQTGVSRDHNTWLSCIIMIYNYSYHI